jgi:filamentous hemagglutinin family protein
MKLTTGTLISRISRVLASMLVLFHTAAFAAPPAGELPTGGQVARGTAQITQNGSRMDINQSTNRAVINWQTFNVGSSAQVNFNQPGSSSATLNRVLSSDPSQIFGKITASGGVFLLNPNGIVFGRGASVNVGALTASTMKMSDDDFMSGTYRFTRDGATGSIVNYGEITGAGGVFNMGDIVTVGSGGRGGRARLTGDRVGLMAGSSLDVSGASGGGSAYVGGGWRGADAPVYSAAT